MNPQGQLGLLDTAHHPWQNRGPAAWALSAALIAFYAVLYWTDAFTAVARAVHLGDKWVLYGLLYSAAMIAGAVRYLRRHGNNPYHRWRIATNVGIQVSLGFTLPIVMPWFSLPSYYFSYFWPLKLDALYPHTLAALPTWIAGWALFGAFVLAPGLSLAFGKRWYCSWVCGCGALANTFGDPWRHLGDKSAAAWRFERVSVHTTLAVVVCATAYVAAGQWLGPASPGFGATDLVKSWLGFAVGAVLSGVVGTGVYPLLGPRFWCRNFCPMAALLGLTQKAGRFRIRVKRDLCISCGNCSTYCEMGIDVRDYAERNESFTRASCVGCGMCAHVCPRGVLRLEDA